MYTFETLTLYVHSSGENEAVVSFKKSFLQICKVQSELTELSPAPGRLKREQKKAVFFKKSCLITRVGIFLAGGCWSSAGTMTGRFSSRTIKSKEWVAGDAAEAAMFL